jgi:hypothetical protein
VNTRQDILSTIDTLDESEITELANFISFLKFRRRVAPFTTELQEQELAALYSEAAAEDHVLAENGMTDYQTALLREDSL